ncbi:hypothetical protein ACFSQJ_13575 [Croceitalea marina]|uniref:Outer membrane protein beta-barrel domain-containing protein n=1 Tax=Croceitalea marina TaxID=1775166 RepID=A0ABW5MZQ6_9FLAO
MEKKNLEKLYQEKLKDFRQVPDEHVWESIAASLDKKKKKRVIPLWWKLGGVAALLALFVFVINPFESAIPEDQTTSTEKNTDQNPEKNTRNQKLSNDSIEIIRAENEPKLADTEKADQTNETNTIQITTTQSSQKDNVNEAAGQQFANTKTQKDQQKESVKNKGRILVAENEPSNERRLKKNNNQIDFNKSLSNNSKNSEVATTIDTEKEKVDTDLYKKDALDKELSNTKEAVAKTAVDSLDLENGKKSIFDAIKEKEDQEEVAEVETKENKWSVGPSIAPVYFDAVGQGSPIHSNFVENSKSGNINLSYGLTVAYDLGKRLKVRSGIHKVDYGYDTNEIVFSSSIAANSTGTIDNINFSQSSRTIVVQSKKAASNELSSPNASDFAAQTPERDGIMSQQLGYLEVPLELNYTLVDKKVGVNLIGGFSSLFLVDNSVSLQSEGLVTEIGEANNVNTVNFSGNFGLGFSYEFSPKIQINLEPVFKYQLNTFSQTAGSFNPYSVGIYSGVRFNF